MKRKVQAPKQGLHLVIVPSGKIDEPIGFHAVAGRLQQIDRLPGESLKAMAHRALALATGEGAMLVFPMHRVSSD
jgi:hypothetical protein